MSWTINYDLSPRHCMHCFHVAKWHTGIQIIRDARFYLNIILLICWHTCTYNLTKCIQANQILPTFHWAVYQIEPPFSSDYILEPAFICCFGVCLWSFCQLTTPPHSVTYYLIYLQTLLTYSFAVCNFVPLWYYCHVEWLKGVSSYM